MAQAVQLTSQSCNLDLFCANKTDLLPVVSTVTSVVYLVLKVASCVLPKTIIRTYSLLSYSRDVNFFRCIVLAVPLLGNIVVYVYDRVSLGSQKRNAIDNLFHADQLAQEEFSSSLQTLEFACERGLWVHGKRVSSDDLEEIAERLTAQRKSEYLPCNERMCKTVAASIAVFSGVPFLWSLLGHSLGENGRIVLKERVVNRRDCWLEMFSLCCEKSSSLEELKQYSFYPSVWELVGNLIEKRLVSFTLRNGEKVSLDFCRGQKNLPQNATERHKNSLIINITHYPDVPFLWGCLGQLMDAEEIVSVKGKRVTRNDCLTEMLTLFCNQSDSLEKLRYHWVLTCNIVRICNIASFKEEELNIVLLRIVKVNEFLNPFILNNKEKEAVSLEFFSELFEMRINDSIPKGETSKQRECEQLPLDAETLVSALLIDPYEGALWKRLAEKLEQNPSLLEPIRSRLRDLLEESPLTVNDCYVAMFSSQLREVDSLEDLKADMLSAKVWCLLGQEIIKGANLTLRDRTTAVPSSLCFTLAMQASPRGRASRSIERLSTNPTNAEGWLELGEQLEREFRDAISTGGTRLTADDCYDRVMRVVESSANELSPQSNSLSPPGRNEEDSPAPRPNEDS